jgi:hypothetical protein
MVVGALLPGFPNCDILTSEGDQATNYRTPYRCPKFLRVKQAFHGASHHINVAR